MLNLQFVACRFATYRIMLLMKPNYNTDFGTSFRVLPACLYRPALGYQSYVRIELTSEGGYSGNREDHWQILIGLIPKPISSRFAEKT